MHRIVSLLSSSSLILAVAACGELADTDYPGEALVTLHGSVTNPQALTVDDGELKAFLIWLPSDGGTVVVADEVAVDANLPADFTLQVLEQPPASALGEFGAIAVILLMTSAQKDDLVTQITDPAFEDFDVGVVGLAQGMLYYLETAEQAAAFPLDVDGNRGVIGFNMSGVITTCDTDDVCTEGSAQVPLNSAIPVVMVDTDTTTGLTIGG